MSDAVTVRVNGEATRRVGPDRATVRLTVEGRGAAAGSAVADLRSATAPVDAALGRHHASITAREASRVTARPNVWRDARTGEERRDGYVATRTTSVEVAPAAAVASLIDDVTATVPDVAIDGPWWTVDPDNPVHAEVRAEAAADARSRAEAYARGLGVGVGAAVRIAEPGLGGWGAGPAGQPGEMVRAMMGDYVGQGHDGAALIDVGEEQVEVSAHVEVEFRLT
ncbi:MAG: SIMPL domain-containing protein [Acidimicrobiales bacterium]|nr:SIMPL domain-containing protein [Acidimicrobiales bacterium]